MTPQIDMSVFSTSTETADELVSPEEPRHELQGDRPK